MTKNTPTVCFDYDFLLYSCACVTEQRKILVINNITGQEQVFKNKTEFWGNYRKKDGGYLAEINKNRTTPYIPEDFTIEDMMFTEPIGNAIKILNSQITKILSVLDTKKYIGYTGRGDVFRHKVATLQPYKGNREGLIKPTHLEELKDYVERKHNAQIVTELEADDWCSIENYQAYGKYQVSKSERDKLIVVAVDKDAKGTVGFLYNPEHFLEPELINGLGWLKRNSKGDIDGRGRKFLYWQVCAGDTSDNYDPACISKNKGGQVKTYELLKDCKTDKECLEAMVKYFKYLYPEPVTFTNFRGDEIEVDWLYVLQEMFTLARMLRWEDDFVQIKDVLDSLGVDYA